MKNIRIGTCGYGYYQPPGDWKNRYESKLQAFSDAFSVGEINRTFYKLPMVKTAERWRREAFEDFEFTVKAWQAITHPVESPTWRKRRVKLSKSQEEQFGNFNPEKEVIRAWDETRRRVEAMEARVCVFQTSAGFDCTAHHEDNLREFIGTIDRGEIQLAWEPRGDWNENLSKVHDLCEELNLIHVVDIMRRDPVSPHPVAYIRLHGLNEREYDYNYEYSESGLRELGKKVQDLATSHDEVYCMFNNFSMYENARRLRELLG